MATDPLPWPEVLRRRNGLPPLFSPEQTRDAVEELRTAHDRALPQPDACTVVEVDGTPIAVRGTGDFTARDQEMFAEVVRAAKRRFEAENAAVPRCLHDLPAPMCHHCKEITDAQP